MLPNNAPPKSPPDAQIAVTTADGSLTMLRQDLDECYHSRAGARLEAETLFIRASDFSGSLAQSCGAMRVLDIGLGLGYNAMATVQAWLRGAPCRRPLEMWSLENYEALVEQLSTGQAAWQSNWPASELEVCQRLKKTTPSHWQAVAAHPSSEHPLDWNVICDDAREAVRRLSEQAEYKNTFHFFWQDPFSPQKSPQLWTVDFFSNLYKLAAPGAVLMTYSAARVVKDNLNAAGWQCERIPGSGFKRHWLRASIPAES